MTSPFLLSVHHIDGNRTNNDVDNLEVVCANCHMIRHLKLVNDEWMYCSSSLTPRDKLSELTAVFIQDISHNKPTND